MSMSSGWSIKEDPHHSAPTCQRAADLLQRSSSEVDLTAAEDGIGGVYFVGRDGDTIAVFKPVDEEAGAINNPKGHTDQLLRHDDGAPREVAAYVLDQQHGGWSGVPATAHVVATRPGEKKWGSMQAHVAHDDSAENFGAAIMPATDVHKIGVFDIRTVNNDRHFANILVSRNGGAVRLTPIDHGAILPSYLDLGRARFEWMQWKKQSTAPFSKETLAHIASLNPEQDAQCLRALGIEEKCILSMVLATKILKLGALRGLTLWDIGNCIQRDMATDDCSPLERAILNIAGEAPTAAAVGTNSTRIAEEVVLGACEPAQAADSDDEAVFVVPKFHATEKDEVQISSKIQVVEKDSPSAGSSFFLLLSAYDHESLKRLRQLQNCERMLIICM